MLSFLVNTWLTYQDLVVHGALHALSSEGWDAEPRSLAAPCYYAHPAAHRLKTAFITNGMRLAARTALAEELLNRFNVALCAI